MATLLSRRLGIHFGLSPRFFRRSAVGDCAEILAPIQVAPGTARTRVFVNEARGRKACELAIPASTAPEALAGFEELFARHPRALNNPIGLRMSAGDSFSLSPCSGRDTLWLDIFYDEAEPFVTDLAEVATQAGARCHWGKSLARPPSSLVEAYPDWEEFREVRRRLDPDEIFANAFTDALDLTATGVTGPGP